jgi:hypothetical protein
MYNPDTSTQNVSFASAIEENTQTVISHDEIIVNNLPNSVSQSDYLNSIELIRQNIRSQLSDLFEISNSNKEVDFLFENQYFLQLLPNIGKHLLNRFGEDTFLSLELLDENQNWQTLFITVKTKLDWEKANNFQHEFFDNLYELFPSAAEKLNIDFIPHEV